MRTHLTEKIIQVIFLQLFAQKFFFYISNIQNQNFKEKSRSKLFDLNNFLKKIGQEFFGQKLFSQL